MAFSFSSPHDHDACAARTEDAFKLELLTAADIAMLLGKSVSAVRGDLSRAPGRLPPAIRIPGGGQALWLGSTVLKWLQSHETGGGNKARAASRRPGRPTKVEQQRRAAAAERAGGAA